MKGLVKGMERKCRRKEANKAKLFKKEINRKRV